MLFLQAAAGEFNWLLPVTLVVVILAIYFLTNYYQHQQKSRRGKPSSTRTVNDSSYKLEDNVTPDRPADAQKGPQLPPSEQVA